MAFKEHGNSGEETAKWVAGIFKDANRICTCVVRVCERARMVVVRVCVREDGGGKGDGEDESE